MSLLPRQAVPALTLPLLDGTTWSLAEERPQNFTLLVVYRGYHCPICSGYLKDLDRKLGDFAERGVSVVAASSDDAERAGLAQSEWKLENLRIAYGLSIEQSQAWGLYLSTSRGKTSTGVEEPAIFTEPGLFLIRPDCSLYFASVQTMPFARPNFADILKALDFVIAKDYPARGELSYAAAKAA